MKPKQAFNTNIKFSFSTFKELFSVLIGKQVLCRLRIGMKSKPRGSRNFYQTNPVLTNAI